MIYTVWIRRAPTASHKRVICPRINKRLSTGPTAENALAADRQLARAIRENDTAGIVRMLDETWAVISTFGDVAEGPETFPSGIRSGFRVVKMMEVSEPRVRLYGNVAVITTKVRLAGVKAGTIKNLRNSKVTYIFA
jgi:ketosteroid isomerase-like protein